VTTYRAPLDQLGFVLDHVVGLDRLLPGAALDPDLTRAILAEAGRFAETVLAPLNTVGDRQGAVLESGAVRTAPGLKRGLRTLRRGRLDGPRLSRSLMAGRPCPGP
jgi:hypothetical protein